MHEKVVEYFEQSRIDFRRVWGLDRYLSLHYGFYDDEHTTHGQALMNSNKVLANRLLITSADVVLDAGCGIGGSSIWLAKNYGCKVVGISVVPAEVKRARGLAKDHGVEHLASFELQDYTGTSFPDACFSAVWGLESVCYALDKKIFLQEAWRLLKGGGRIAVADGFAKRRPGNRHELFIQRRWLQGWAIPNLASAEGFAGDLKAIGYEDIHFADVTANIMPSSRRLCRAALLNYPLAIGLLVLGTRTKLQMDNLASAYYQHRAVAKDLWQYGIFVARKRSARGAPGSGRGAE